MNDFKVVDLLYKGDVSDIWQGIHVASNTEVHVVTVNKKVNGHIFDQKRMMDLEPLVSQIAHPHMLKYHKIVQNDNTIGIIMEHPKGGCLRDYLLRRPEKKLAESEARGFFQQIVSAVEYINQFNVVYRNLNLRNIFIDKNNGIKIGDFLVCTKVGPIYKPSSATSSYHFYAPEIWLEDGRAIDAAADVWSLGVLLYVMTCGCYPFDGKHEFDIFLSVKRGQFAIPSTLSDECASLIKAILHPEPSKRPAISQLKNHPWYMGTTAAAVPQKRVSPPSALGPLPGISEADEDEPNSPAIPLLVPFQNMKIESQPSPQFSARPAQMSPMPPFYSPNTYAQFQPQVPARQEEQQRPRKKRASADEEVHKVIEKYFELKREDNQHSASSFISNVLGSRNNVADSFNSSVVRPPPKRRSSDSILHNEEVMRLLGLGAEELGTNPFSQTEPMTQPVTRPMRSSSSGGDGRRPKIAASPSTKRATKPRRRSSLDANSMLVNQSNSNFIQGFNNIFLPQQPSPEQRTEDGTASTMGDTILSSNYQQHPNYQNLQSISQTLPSYQTRQMQNMQQARELEYQRDAQKHLQNLLGEYNQMGDPTPQMTYSPQDQSRLAAQPVQGSPPFMDDELRREIENLPIHADLDDPSLDLNSLLDSTAGPSIDDWLNSVAQSNPAHLNSQQGGQYQ